MISIKKNWYKVILVAFLVIVPILSFAQGHNSTCDPAGGKICNPLESKNINDIPTFIKTLLEGLLTIGIPIVALAVIYSGFLFVEARGNSEKIGKAKESLMYTLVGAGILLGSYAIAQLISATVTGLTK